MSGSERVALVEFIAPRFDGIDNRFDAVDDRLVGFNDRLRRVEILGEDARHHIQIVARVRLSS